VAIGVTASIHQAVLLTRNARDFTGIPGLRAQAAGRG
jgi:predicted nucleic acid-binding protein